MFDFIKSIFALKKNNHNDENRKDLEKLKEYTMQYDPLNVDSIAKDDYLGLAASAKHRAKIAIQEKNYELAWSLYSEQKKHLFSHCEKNNFTHENMQALDGEVSHSMANVLRLEKNHILALGHLIYAISTNPNVAYMMKKLPTYYNRAKINISFDEVMHFVYEQQKKPDFRCIQNKIFEWKEL